MGRADPACSPCWAGVCVSACMALVPPPTDAGPQGVSEMKTRQTFALMPRTAHSPYGGGWGLPGGSTLLPVSSEE